MTFADLLRRYLTRDGLSQAELSRRTGVHIGTINHLLRGRRSPTREQVQAFALAFGLSVFHYDELLYAAGLICSSCPMARYRRETLRTTTTPTRTNSAAHPAPRSSAAERTHQCPPPAPPAGPPG